MSAPMLAPSGRLERLSVAAAGGIILYYIYIISCRVVLCGSGIVVLSREGVYGLRKTRIVLARENPLEARTDGRMERAGAKGFRLRAEEVDNVSETMFIGSELASVRRYVRCL